MNVCVDSYNAEAMLIPSIHSHVRPFTQLLKAITSGNVLMIQALLAYDPHLAVTSDYDGSTPLHYAVVRASVDIAKRLIERGANVNSRNTDGATPLTEASAAGRADMVELLLTSGAYPNLACQQHTALHQAAAAGHVHICRLLLAAGAHLEASDGWHGTPLHVAVHRQQFDVIRTLLAAGANVDAQFIHRRPLHVACTSGPNHIRFTDEKSDPRVALLLLAYGANPRALDNAGRQALMLAEQEYDVHAEAADAEWIFTQRCLLRALRTLCQSPSSLKQLCHVVIRRNADVLCTSARLLPPHVHTDVVTCETHNWRLKPDLLADYATVMRIHSTLAPTEIPFS